MPATSTFLLEVGCEEIPAAALPAGLEDLRARLLAELAGGEGGGGLGGEAEAPPPLGGPRRLVALIGGIREREEDRLVQVTGPPVAAAFDSSGRPTRAAAGFAKAQGVEVSQLERVKGEKGEVVAARKKVIGRRASEVLAQACPRLLGAMRFPKMMKWGDRGYCFVRPVHWILALLDDQVVDFEFMGVRSGRCTRGHRFLAPGPIEVPRARDYERLLRDRGLVVAGNEARRRGIVEGRDRAAAAMGWTAQEDEELVRELTFLNERPGVIAGTFPPGFLELPEPVLVTAMKHHQKYFPARDASGKLAPGFLAVINREDDPSGAIRRGNEWVLKARLADAAFFWGEDRKRRLEDRVADLERITFQEKLGSNLLRTVRLEELAGRLARECRLPAAAVDQVRLAARLCKADLTTGMVGEFPELQGIMGGIYARADGAPETVARAIEEHYRPASTADRCPATVEGCLVALADKIDLMTGCFAAGLIPKGSADPYGLRRAAHGVCRILLSEPLAGRAARVSLRGAVRAALDLFAAQGLVAETADAEPALEFLAQRLRFLMEESGMRFDTARAALAAGSDDVEDAWRRASSLTALRGPEHEADFEALATSAKRIRNILAQAREQGISVDGAAVNPKRLVDAEEKELHGAVSRVAGAIEKEIASGDYKAALREIASLRPKVDRFFDKVLVMSPDEALRRNRLALLSGLSALLSRVADFSEIVVEGEASERNA